MDGVLVGGAGRVIGSAFSPSKSGIDFNLASKTIVKISNSVIRSLSLDKPVSHLSANESRNEHVLMTKLFTNNKVF